MASTMTKTRMEKVAELNAKIDNAKETAANHLCHGNVRMAMAYQAKADSLKQTRDEIELDLYEKYGVTV